MRAEPPSNKVLAWPNLLFPQLSLPKHRQSLVTVAVQVVATSLLQPQEMSLEGLPAGLLQLSSLAEAMAEGPGGSPAYNLFYHTTGIRWGQREVTKQSEIKRFQLAVISNLAGLANRHSPGAGDRRDLAGHETTSLGALRVAMVGQEEETVEDTVKAETISPLKHPTLGWLGLGGSGIRSLPPCLLRLTQHLWVPLSHIWAWNFHPYGAAQGNNMLASALDFLPSIPPS